jgi:hypothetical protein
VAKNHNIGEGNFLGEQILMSSVQQNRHIARLIVGAMIIDGELSDSEQKKVAIALQDLHMQELVADFGAALEDDFGDFNMFEECKFLMESMGDDADSAAPMIFRLIVEVIASDRFVSAQEASYISAMARRFRLATETTQKIFGQVMAERRGRLEISARDVDEMLHPHLKEILSFEGADELVGEVSEDSLEEMLHDAQAAMAEGCSYTKQDVDRGLAVLGLSRAASLEEATEVWKETIHSVDLKTMAGLGETFVTAALNRLTEINDAYKVVLHVHEHIKTQDKAKNEIERLESKIERDKKPSKRDDLAYGLETELTGVGVPGPDEG